MRWETIITNQQQQQQQLEKSEKQFLWKFTKNFNEFHLPHLNNNKNDNEWLFMSYVWLFGKFVCDFFFFWKIQAISHKTLQRICDRWKRMMIVMISSVQLRLFLSVCQCKSNIWFIYIQNERTNEWNFIIPTVISNYSFDRLRLINDLMWLNCNCIHSLKSQTHSRCMKSSRAKMVERR